MCFLLGVSLTVIKEDCFALADVLTAFEFSVLALVNFVFMKLPSRTILDRTYSAQRFSFSIVIFLSVYFGSCGRLSWLYYQLLSTR